MPESVKIGDILYRAEADVRLGERVSIIYWEYEVVKVTPCGAWVKGKGFFRMGDTLGRMNPFSLQRWCSLTPHGRRRFAWRTKEEALESLKARTRAWYRHARHRLDRAEAVLRHLDIPIPVLTLDEKLRRSTL